MAERSKAEGNGDAEASAAAALDNAANEGGSATPNAAERRSADDTQATSGEDKSAQQAQAAPKASVRSTTGNGSTATATRPVVHKSAVSETGGRATLTAAGNGIRRARNLIASIVWLVAVLCAAILALGALFTALSQTNESNQIVQWVLARGEDLVGPFGDLFELETAKNTILVNWGIAALVYLVVGRLAERIIRP